VDNAGVPSGDPSEPLLAIERLDDDRTVTLRLCGEVDITTIDRLEREALAVTDGSRLVLDCRPLELIDSSGLAVLLALRRRFGTELRLVRGPEPLQRLFEMTGLADILAVYDTPELAAGD
jgi:anti-anti-sigma factor